MDKPWAKFLDADACRVLRRIYGFINSRTFQDFHYPSPEYVIKDFLQAFRAASKTTFIPVDRYTMKS